jgi:hypothetical protein
MAGGMSFKLTDNKDELIGAFSSVDDAKLLLPQVHEWRQDEHRPMGWNGWLPDAAPFSPPDYKITFVATGKGRCAVPE